MGEFLSFVPCVLACGEDQHSGKARQGFSLASSQAYIEPQSVARIWLPGRWKCRVVNSRNRLATVQSLSYAFHTSKDANDNLLDPRCIRPSALKQNDTVCQQHTPRLKHGYLFILSPMPPLLLLLRLLRFLLLLAAEPSSLLPSHSPHRFEVQVQAEP